MADRPPQTTIMFGDMQTARLIRYGKPYTDITSGMEMQELIIEPSPMLIKKYNLNINKIGRTESGEKGGIYLFKSYQEVMISPPIPRSEERYGLFILCDFEGKENTFLMNLEPILTKRVLAQQSLITGLKHEILANEQEMEEVRGNLNIRLQEMKKSMDIVAKGKKEEDEETGQQAESPEEEG